MRIDHPLRIDGLAPLLLDAHDLAPAARRDVAHALAEHAVDADDHDVARIDEVHERGFHARRPGTADRQRQFVLGAEHRAQAITRLVEQHEEVGVEVPEQRTGEGLSDFGIGIAGAGTHEHAVAMGHRRSLG